MDPLLSAALLTILIPFPTIQAFETFLRRKEPRTANYWLAYLIIAAETFLLQILALNQMRIVFITITYSLVILLLYEGKLLHKLVSFLLCAIIILFSEFLIVIIFKIIDIPNLDLLNNYTQAFFYNLAVFLTVILVFNIISSFLKAKTSRIRTRYWLMFLPYSFFALCAQLVFSWFIVDNPSQMSVIIMLLIGLGLFFTSLSFVFVMNRIELALRREQKNQLKLAAYKNQERQMELIEYNRSEIRKLSHDMKNHLYVISAYLCSNQVTEAQSYLNKFIQICEENKPVANYGNDIVNYVVGFFNRLCAEKQIRFQVTIEKITTSFPLDELDTCNLLSNLLNNAVEATEKVTEKSVQSGKSAEHTTEKRIHLEIQQAAGVWAITVENSYNGELKQAENGRGFVSTKKDAEQHGIGSNIIADTVEKYHGDLKYEISASLFIVKIMLTEEQK